VPARPGDAQSGAGAFAQGKLGPADDVLRQGQEALEKLAADFPEASRSGLDLVKTRIDRVNLLVDAGRLPEANALAVRRGPESGERPGRLRPRRRRSSTGWCCGQQHGRHAWVSAGSTTPSAGSARRRRSASG